MSSTVCGDVAKALSQSNTFMGVIVMSHHMDVASHCIISTDTKHCGESTRRPVHEWASEYLSECDTNTWYALFELPKDKNYRVLFVGKMHAHESFNGEITEYDEELELIEWNSQMLDDTHFDVEI